MNLLGKLNKLSSVEEMEGRTIKNIRDYSEDLLIHFSDNSIICINCLCGLTEEFEEEAQVGVSYEYLDFDEWESDRLELLLENHSEGKAWESLAYLIDWGLITVKDVEDLIIEKKTKHKELISRKFSKRFLDIYEHKEYLKLKEKYESR